ncbi:Y-family DNA polymerase [Methylibium petroleiphilum]|nr:Y-family DNA polymerase [Methylibium petroleiphilum]
MYALVDGNNFYCSVERVFRPSLTGRPVVVMGSNDGCVIARSNEAKALGVKMGEPWFQCRHLEKDQGLVALSANFTLYGDMSERMMTVAGSFAPRQEVYSIDECFLDFAGMPGGPGSLVETGRALREKVLRWTGIPTCVGFGPTKTLAKLANHIAKSAERKPGSYPEQLAQVCNLGELADEVRRELLVKTEVKEVWGVGPRIGAQLNAAGVSTVLDLVRLDPAAVRRRFSVVLEKTVLELRGISCLTLEDAPASRQQIMCSRSFGRPVLEMEGLVEALSDFAARAAEKLRKQENLAGAVHVFITTSPFRKEDRQYSRSVTVPLVRPTGDTRVLVSAAILALRAVFKPGYRYAKAGVMLMELQPESVHQAELDLGEPEPGTVPRDRSKLMSAVDAVNRRHGRGSLMVASAGLATARREFVPKQERRTPHYTTSWDDMPVARA